MRQAHQQPLNEFQTRDIYLATVIKQAGIPIIRVEKNEGRGIFVFRASEKIDGIISGYFNDELQVAPKALFETWKALKSMAYSKINDMR